MTYKKFRGWCNKRACDGCWSMNTASTCIQILDYMKTVPFWKRGKVFKAHFSDYANEIAIFTEEVIAEQTKKELENENN